MRDNSGQNTQAGASRQALRPFPPIFIAPRTAHPYKGRRSEGCVCSRLPRTRSATLQADLRTAPVAPLRVVAARQQEIAGEGEHDRRTGVCARWRQAAVASHSHWRKRDQVWRPPADHPGAHGCTLDAAQLMRAAAASSSGAAELWTGGVHAPDGVARAHADPLRDRAVLLQLLGERLLDGEGLVARLRAGAGAAAQVSKRQRGPARCLFRRSGAASNAQSAFGWPRL